ncbi:MAG TPA: RNA polymerase sigma factor [Kofleriaceae bacterium]|nr:RNA polymerase sigma factor [Kofleriaceae bacterium]
MTGKLVALRRISGDITEMSDEALLAACGTGDAPALGALFDRFHAAVYRFAARLPMTDDLARDDLVQATFLEVRRAARSFRGTSSVKTWILGIAANVARHTLRAERRRRVHQARYLERMTAAPEQLDTQVERRKLLARVAEALAQLPRDQQVAFILCDLEQLPGVEVARVLEVPEGTLWRRLHTARKAMREAVEKATR